MQSDKTEMEQRIENLSDEELIKMIEIQFNDYTKEALQIARKVVKNRGGMKNIKEKLSKIKDRELEKQKKEKELTFKKEMKKPKEVIHNKAEEPTHALPSSISTSTVSNKLDEESQSSSMVTGAILFVIGLIAIIMRGEITVKIVGRGQILSDAFLGGGSTESTFTAIIVISGIAMIAGLILFIKGIIKVTGNK